MSYDTDRTTRNRLGAESSPYLLLHAGNPVDWYPWGEEAIARARAEDKPIFLSVGYSTCHWCHVMERESFSDPAIAALMNEHFVNVKVDREERPDLDEIYMVATQALSGHGGWPNSVFLTPELAPFFAGTYFPPADRQGLPGFPTVLRSLADAWRHRRADVEEQAKSVAGAIHHYLGEGRPPAADLPGPEAARRSLAGLAHRFDRQWGGFGGAPKFPTPSNLFLLHELGARDERAGEMLASTLDQMARGGIYDQLGGGFHRYATDREWKIPHFEKMLYDNGLLLELYARAWARTRDPEMARVARQTAAFLGREMTSPEGALWSAIDADTGGEEGAFYVWTREELRDALGEEDFGFLAPIYGFDGAPFFEGDRYVLHVPRPAAELAARRRLTTDELWAQVEPRQRRLLAARARRPRPATDDKILADWNGMAIAGLAVAGELLPDPRLVGVAVAAAGFLLEHLRPAGVLLHAWRGGRGRVEAFLADYAFLVRGLLALARASGEERWLAAARDLVREQRHRLAAPQGGWFNSGDRPDVLVRSREVFDGAVPAANAVAVLNLLEMAERTGDQDYRHDAEAALRAFAPLLEAQPDGARMLAVAALRAAESRRAKALAPAPAEPEAGTPVLREEARSKVGARLELGDAAAGGWRPFRLILTIAPGWHLEAAGEEPGRVATEVACEGGAVRALRYPAGEPLEPRLPARGPVGVDAAGIYRGEVTITGELRSGRAPGGARLRVHLQPCDESRCLPAFDLAVPLPAASGAPEGRIREPESRA